MAHDERSRGDSPGLLRDLFTIAFANRRFRWTLAVIVAAPLVFYGVEDLCVRARFPLRDPYRQVAVHRVYMLHKSREKMNIINAEPGEQTCVRAVFPHLGYTPCWYLERHTEQQVDFQ
jgi:hypothetical protein